MNIPALQYEGIYGKSQFCWKALEERRLILLVRAVQYSFESLLLWAVCLRNPGWAVGGNKAWF
jgi:hypothetical protein